MTSHIEFSELIYSNHHKGGSLRLYVYDIPGHPGYHSGPKYLTTTPLRSDEITLSAARKRAEDAIAAGHEVRITNSLDFPVFHAKDGAVIYPQDAEKFWEEVCR